MQEGHCWNIYGTMHNACREMCLLIFSRIITLANGFFYQMYIFFPSEESLKNKVSWTEFIQKYPAGIRTLNIARWSFLLAEKWAIFVHFLLLLQTHISVPYCFESPQTLRKRISVDLVSCRSRRRWESPLCSCSTLHLAHYIHIASFYT